MLHPSGKVRSTTYRGNVSSFRSGVERRSEREARTSAGLPSFGGPPTDLGRTTRGGDQFGPEYDRAVDSAESRREAESEL
jgi:hypothetical protein